MCYIIKVFKGKNLFNVQNSPLHFNGTEDNKFINGFRFFTVTNFREIIFCVIWESKETEIPKIILKKGTEENSYNLILRLTIKLQQS